MAKQPIGRVQLNADTSVVDYLKSQGQDSSFSARKKIAKDMGMTNYTGSEEQNIAMRNALAGGASKEVALYDNAPKSEKPKAEKPKTLYDSDVPATFTPKTEVAVGTGVSQDVWDAMHKTFTAPTAYDEAMSLTMSKLEQLSSGRTSYTDQIKELMAQIQGRDKFSYDVSQDTLFQQSLASAMASGKTAMQDTIGQASALTGGYGSTYATSAGNQAYNGYIQDAYANLPEYYQMALEAYQMEGQEMYDQLAMLNSADATEYQRTYDAWSANFANAQNIYNQAYGEWQDSINNAYNMGNLQLNEQGQLFDQTSALYSQEFNEWRTMADHAYNEKALKQDQTQFDDSLKQDDDHFYASLNAKGNDNVKVDENGVELEEASQKMYHDALTTYSTGGEDALFQYIATLPSNIDTEALVERVFTYGIGQFDGWEMEKDTKNWGGGDDNNDVYKKGNQTLKFKELKKQIEASDLSEEEKARLIKALKAKSMN